MKRSTRMAGAAAAALMLTMAGPAASAQAQTCSVDGICTITTDEIRTDVNNPAYTQPPARPALLLTLTGIDRTTPIDPCRGFILGQAFIQEVHFFASRQLVTPVGETTLVNDMNILQPSDPCRVG